MHLEHTRPSRHPGCLLSVHEQSALGMYACVQAGSVSCAHLHQIAHARVSVNKASPDSSICAFSAAKGICGTQMTRHMAARSGRPLYAPCAMSAAACAESAAAKRSARCFASFSRRSASTCSSRSAA